MDGALLIDKPAGMSSFGVIEELQRMLLRHPGACGLALAPAVSPTVPKKMRPLTATEPGDLPPARKRDLPTMGHGGTLDPFATGLLAVCVGRGVKLARYFLGSGKTYEGVIRFGETTVPGDPTAEISERSDALPPSLGAIQEAARRFTLGPYLQTPPMFSAKKKQGKPLYELARQGIEIDRDAKALWIHSFEILSYEPPRATFRAQVSSGTYIRTLAQDLGKGLGTVAMLDSLHRTESGIHRLAPTPDEQTTATRRAMTLEEIARASELGARWDELAAWVEFDRLLDGYERAEATPDEVTALTQGRQAILPRIIARLTPPPAPPSPHQTASGAVQQNAPVVIHYRGRIVAIARLERGMWGLERVFVREQDGNGGTNHSENSLTQNAAAANEPQTQADSRG